MTSKLASSVDPFPTGPVGGYLTGAIINVTGGVNF
jgi:hypothetical protein